jgi:catechol 2,3-dioxygenase-like lactoylglutathione lyase family enzyme
VKKQRPVFNQVNLVVRDMAAMVEFYERLGVEFTRTVPPWERHHRTFAEDNVVEEFDFDLDSQAFATQWDEGWPAAKTGPVFGFRLSSPEAVDEIYLDLTNAGYAGQQPPWDGFMGARYAVVADPDGNSVGLMGPIDPARTRVPSPPDE